MGNLVRVDVTSIIEKLLPVLGNRKEIVGAYLFGSILGLCRPDSDIDVAILLSIDSLHPNVEDENIKEDILQELPSIQDRPLDLVILNYSSAIFAYKIINEGLLFYKKDYDAITDFMETVSRKRAENYPRYRKALEIIVKG